MSEYRRRLLMQADDGDKVFYSALQFTKSGLATDIIHNFNMKVSMSCSTNDWISGNTYQLFAFGSNMNAERLYVSRTKGRITGVRDISTTERYVEYNKTLLRSYKYVALSVDTSKERGDGTYTVQSNAPISEAVIINNRAPTNYTDGNANYNKDAVYTLTIFTNYSHSRVIGGTETFYWLKIEENGVVTHHLVPYGKGGKVGVLDTVTNKFYSEITGGGTVIGIP